MLSRSFSSEKSYSPSRLRCRQATVEPWATASRSASRLSVSVIFSNLGVGEQRSNYGTRSITVPLLLRPHFRFLSSPQLLANGQLSPTKPGPAAQRFAAKSKRGIMPEPLAYVLEQILR